MPPPASASLPNLPPGSTGCTGWSSAPTIPHPVPSHCVSRSEDSFSQTPLGGAVGGCGEACLGGCGLFILSGISILNSSLFEESQGFGASKHPGPIRRPQPVPTSCISVTAKKTAHQLPEPCSPGEFLPDQEMPDRGDRVGAAPWPWAQLGVSPWSEREGHPGAGRSLGGWETGEMCLLLQLTRD